MSCKALSSPAHSVIRCSDGFNGSSFWLWLGFIQLFPHLDEVGSDTRFVLSAQIKEHLAKGQRTLAADGMSQVTKTLLDLTQRKNFYAGDLLISVEILRNVTDTFKRASYIPASDGVQVRQALKGDFFHLVVFMSVCCMPWRELNLLNARHKNASHQGKIESEAVKASLRVSKQHSKWRMPAPVFVRISASLSFQACSD